MKRTKTAIIVLTVLVLSLCACQKEEPAEEKTVFDRIRESTVARMDLTDGTSIIVDSEIASLKTFADLQLQAAPMEPADSVDDWLYRIVFDPSNKVQGTEQIIVSFHADYV